MNREKKVRVRFAPSPTGHLHIGGLRTALFNYLFAKHHNGSFLIRIEDTDVQRDRQEYTDAILAAFAWCNLLPDEDIVIQSTRLNVHIALAEKLIAEKKAYRCYCLPDEFAARCAQQKVGEDLFIMYDGFCRDKEHQREGKPYVVRFARPLDQKEVTFHDLIRGQFTFDMNQLDDFIFLRSDGQPMYNFVVVADDNYMGITHVIRGEDHISNTPKQILLYNACGFEVPQFAHIPMILGPSGNRLSKRDGATSVLDFQKAGYLPDAFLNYLVRLGWAHGDQEIFTREELIQYFSLEQVGKKGSIFDPEKLNWINSVYMEALSDDRLYQYIQQYIRPDIEHLLSGWNFHMIYTAISLYKSRVSTLSQLVAHVLMLHDGPKSEYNQEDVEKFISPMTADHLRATVGILSSLESYDKDIISQKINLYTKQQGIKFVAIGQPLRIALLGCASGPGVFDMLALLGKRAVERIENFIEYAERSARI